MLIENKVGKVFDSNVMTCEQDNICQGSKKVGTPILVCDLFWTLKNKSMMDRKHMLHGIQDMKNKWQHTNHDLCAHVKRPPCSAL